MGAVASAFEVQLDIKSVYLWFANTFHSGAKGTADVPSGCCRCFTRRGGRSLGRASLDSPPRFIAPFSCDITTPY